jgi:hypothetical protein
MFYIMLLLLMLLAAAAQSLGGCISRNVLLPCYIGISLKIRMMPARHEGFRRCIQQF